MSLCRILNQWMGTIGRRTVDEIVRGVERENERRQAVERAGKGGSISVRDGASSFSHSFSVKFWLTECSLRGYFHVSD